MRGCMAGAAITGDVAHRTRAVARSSARPSASLANTSAVAGTIAIASAFDAISTCISPAMLESNMSILTGEPVIPDSVLGPTNLVADWVITGNTLAPALIRSRATSTLL